MSRSKKALFLVLAGLLLCTGPAFAKESRGKITGINTHQNFLLVDPLDEKGNPGKTIMLMASKVTLWNGVKSLDEVSVGDVITFDASKEKSAWKLNSFTGTPTKKKLVPANAGSGAAMAEGGYSGN